MPVRDRSLATHPTPVHGLTLALAGEVYESLFHALALDAECLELIETGFDVRGRDLHLAL